MRRRGQTGLRAQQYCRGSGAGSGASGCRLTYRGQLGVAARGCLSSGTAGTRYRGLTETWDELMQVHRRTRLQRQHDTKLVNDVTESATARQLFHGLDPTACPRCDQAIAADRRRQEREAHSCAVCSRPVTGDDHSPKEVIDEAKQRLRISTAAEQTARRRWKRQKQTCTGCRANSHGPRHGCDVQNPRRRRQPVSAHVRRYCGWRARSASSRSCLRWSSTQTSRRH